DLPAAIGQPAVVRVTADLSQRHVRDAQDPVQRRGLLQAEAEIMLLQLPLGVLYAGPGWGLAQLALPADNEVQPAGAARSKVNRGCIGAARHRLADQDPRSVRQLRQTGDQGTQWPHRVRGRRYRVTRG